MQQDSSTTDLKFMTSEQLNAFWDSMAGNYSEQDSCMQTFFYTLINILKIENASNVLEIACGTGKLLPIVLTNKPQKCKYLATDISGSMVQLAELRMRRFAQKVGVEEPFQAWIKGQGMSFRVQNGEEPIESEGPFDRIICNLVLHVAENPKAILKNLHSKAAQGCLLGLSVMSDEGEDVFLRVKEEAMKKLGIADPRVRSYFHLGNKVPELVEGTGWEVLLLWSQNAPISAFELTESLKTFLRTVAKVSDGPKELQKEVFAGMQEIFGRKRALNFPCKLAVLRKV